MPNKLALIVENDIAAAESLACMARSIGLCTYIAGNLAESLKLAQEFDFDVIFLDLLMPDCRGVEAIKSMRTRVPQSPVIAVSSMVSAGDGLDIGKLLDLGVSAVIGKCRLSLEDVKAALVVALHTRHALSTSAAMIDSVRELKKGVTNDDRYPP